jgi:hypothetical protein
MPLSHCSSAAKLARGGLLVLQGLNPLMVDRADSQITLKIAEGFLNLGQLDIKLPELGRIDPDQIGAQQITAFPAPYEKLVRRRQIASAIAIIVFFLED